MGNRTSTLSRATKETRISVELDVDGKGAATITTGLGFLDHMLTTLVKHAGFDLTLVCEGDLDVDDHHSVEDTALALGCALKEALGQRMGIRRFGYAYAPLDETLARTVVDLSGRPSAVIDLAFRGEKIGAVGTENITHFFNSFAMASLISLHVDVLRGDNDHHKAEAAFKSFALALRQAVELSNDLNSVPSTK